MQYCAQVYNRLFSGGDARCNIARNLRTINLSQRMVWHETLVKTRARSRLKLQNGPGRPFSSFICRNKNPTRGRVSNGESAPLPLLTSLFYYFYLIFQYYFIIIFVIFSCFVLVYFPSRTRFQVDLRIRSSCRVSMERII